MPLTHFRFSEANYMWVLSLGLLLLGLFLPSIATLMPTEAKAQAIILPCVPSGTGCIPVSAANPLPTTGGGGGTITSGTTATSGCTDNAVLESRSSLITCDGAILAPSGGPASIGNGGASTSQLVFTPNSGVAASIGMANGGTQLLFGNATMSTQFMGISGSVVVPSGGSLKWSAGATVTSTNDTSISRASAGVAQIGTNTLGNAGSLNLTNLTAQGTLAATLGTATGTNVVCNTPATASLLTVQVFATGCAASSARFKEGIASIDRVKALDDVLQFNAVSYWYRPEFNMGADKHVGFTAEQIGSVDPQWITYEADGVTPHAVKYNEMAALFAAAIQQLNDKFEAYKRSHP